MKRRKSRFKRCIECRAKFTRKPHYSHAYFETQKLCSKECRKSFFIKMPPNFRGGISRRNISLYQGWSTMKDRCLNEKNINYKYYGGKGIRVCRDWMDSAKFIEWAERNGWKKGLTIDRINSNGNYCPSNCEWVTRSENSRRRAMKRGENTKSKLKESEVIKIRKSKLSAKELSVLYNISIPTIYFIRQRRTWKHI